jgi:hypothetical protein
MLQLDSLYSAVRTPCRFESQEEELPVACIQSVSGKQTNSPIRHHLFFVQNSEDDLIDSFDWILRSSSQGRTEGQHNNRANQRTTNYVVRFPL